MRFLVVSTDYNGFIDWLYAEHSGLDSRTYAQQHQIRMGSLFVSSDFYSTSLNRLGHEAWDVIANIEPLQRKWAMEQGIRIKPAWRFWMRRGLLPWFELDRSNWLYATLAAQIRAYKPDVLYSMTMGAITSDFLRQVKGYYRIAIGQHAATELRDDYRAYDLVLTSLPNQVNFFRQQGLRSELLCVMGLGN